MMFIMIVRDDGDGASNESFYSFVVILLSLVDSLAKCVVMGGFVVSSLP